MDERRNSHLAVGRVLRNATLASTLLAFITFSAKAQSSGEDGRVARKEREPSAIVRQVERGILPDGPIVDANGCLMLPENGLLTRSSEFALANVLQSFIPLRSEFDLAGLDLSSLNVEDYDTVEEIQQALSDLLDDRGTVTEVAGYGPSQHVDFYDWDNDGDLDAFVGAKNLSLIEVDDGQRGELDNYGTGGLLYFENVTGEDDSPFPDDYTYFAPVFADDEGPLREFSDTFGPRFIGNPAPRIADLDEDGYPELYVGDQEGHVRRFLVNDDGSPRGTLPYDPETDYFEYGKGGYRLEEAPARGTWLDVGQNAVPDFFDIDGDGTLELVVGRKYGLDELNRGPGAVPPDYEPVAIYRQSDDEGRGGVLPEVWERVSWEDNPFAGEAVVGYTAPFFGDLDGDGLTDALIGSKTGLHYFRNVTGELRGAAPAVFQQQFGLDHPLLGAQPLVNGMAPALADIDGDGDYDYYAGNKALNFVENRGTALDPAFLDMGYSTEFADLDGDGDLDALAGGKLLQPYDPVRGPGALNQPALAYFENVGTPNEPVWERTLDLPGLESLEFSLYSLPAADFVDMDDDGDLDLFVGTKEGGLQYFENQGDPQNPLFVEQPSPFENWTPPDAKEKPPAGGFFASPDPFFVDLDGDGDVDAVVGDKTEEPYGYRLRYFENITDEARGSEFEFQEILKGNPFDDIEVPVDLRGTLDLGEFLFKAPWLADYDFDGDYDLFVGTKTQVFYFENLGTPEDPDFSSEIETAFWLPRLVEIGVEFVDDFLRGNPFTENDFPGTSFLHLAEVATPAVVDVDGDGDYDGFVGVVGINESFRMPGGIVVDPTPVFTSEDGDSQDLMVSLKSQPMGPVTVYIEVSDGSEAESSETSLDFTPENWDTPQLVTITGLPDIENDGDVAYQVIFRQYNLPEFRSQEGELCAELIVEAVNVDAEARNTNLVVSKEVFGTSSFPGDIITYEIVVTNVSDTDQPDLMGPEFEDTLPPELTLLSANSSSPSTSTFGNTVSYNGAIAAGASVVIEITAQINDDVPGGTLIVNQGSAFFDGDEKGESNDAAVLSDDPELPGVADPTVFAVGDDLSSSVLQIPTMSQVGSWAMGALLALFALVGISRQRP